jgi:hypothetical protein
VHPYPREGREGGWRNARAAARRGRAGAAGVDREELRGAGG